ncbi:coiled-coil domain-containing protein 130 [Mytilus galloprovincialis]|uniref:Coiled-coil domain-containing protein 130 n=1 Tax=Mytilus galloprovincialis TaxID=29158 RepID=A0A8B6DU39_MYTGA|nr:coiled-coil domain-containing protein 130 [Mytilus galloprovincialis]
MAERKSVNKYYPPDWDPSKGSVNKHFGQHPLRDRAKKLGQGILVIRFELPYNIWCGGCNSPVGMGVRYNAEKSKVGNYYTTPIYKFRMKCHLCDNYFEIQTDPKNHDYVILCGARRKEQRWDPKDNEQIVPEDKATQKKLATDSMYKLEHGSDDKQRGKSVIKTIGQIADERNQYKDDYIINKIAREKFRNEKKAIKVTEEVDKELLLKSSLDISLVKETDEDKKLAGLLRLRPTETYDEKQIQKRKEIESRPIFETNKTEDLLQKGNDTKQNLAKSIALRKTSPFDTIKSSTNSSKQIRKMLGVRKRSLESNLEEDSPQFKKMKVGMDISVEQAMDNGNLTTGFVDAGSDIVPEDSINRPDSDKSFCDIDKNIIEADTCKSPVIKLQSPITSSGALSLVSVYADSESESSEG